MFGCLRLNWVNRLIDGFGECPGERIDFAGYATTNTEGQRYGVGNARKPSNSTSLCFMRSFGLQRTANARANSTALRGRRIWTRWLRARRSSALRQWNRRR